MRPDEARIPLRAKDGSVRAYALIDEKVMAEEGYLWCEDQLRKPCDGVTALRERAKVVERKVERAMEILRGAYADAPGDTKRISLTLGILTEDTEPRAGVTHDSEGS